MYISATRPSNTGLQPTTARAIMGAAAAEAERWALTTMTIDEFLATIENKLPPAPAEELERLERAIGESLPNDYRRFLVACNGGSVGGSLWFKGPTPEGRDADAGIHHIGGFRKEGYFSLFEARECYEGRIPRILLWVMDDPFGNAICVGLGDRHRGRVYFWDHESQPGDDWDGTVETAGNLQLLANSFNDFVAGLAALDTEEAG